METQQPIFPHWMRGFLMIAFIYNVIWGIFIALFPDSFYHWVTESQRETPGIILWQGRAVLVMGVLYLFAAMYPRKLWYFIALGVFTKVVGGIWFYTSILEMEVGRKGWFHLIMNDAIWVPFLILISLRAFRWSKSTA